jgi:hypothetical protein
VPGDKYTEAEKNTRKRLHDAIQETNDSDPDLEGAVLKAWVLVAEWINADGEPFLSTISGTSNGEDSPPHWIEQGYLHNALYERYGFRQDEE